MLDVWYSISPPPLSPCLNIEERRRRDRFLFDKHRHAFTQAHTLKRLVLTSYEPGMAPQAWRFENRAGGKPVIVQPTRYQFNLSHSESSVAVAIARTEVGVDIELCRPLPRLAALAESVFHPGEQRWLWRQSCLETSFFRLWTLKEALLKAAGTGFSYHPARFCCDALDGGAATAWVAGARWRCLSRYVGDFALSVAIPYDAPASDLRHVCVESTPQPAPAPGLASPVVDELLQYVRVDP
jgi:4'-phosphopantetheinyl transferase